ncbi:MAG: hypothetical protein IJ717_00520 [Treponema sp.]|nr:hypothetical protein [Treponema sp.]
MLAVNGYYDGTGYVTEDNVTVKPNQRVIITYLDEFEKPKRKLKKYVGKISEDKMCERAMAVFASRKL